MTAQLIQDWTESQVLLKFGDHKEVKYKIYKHGEKLFQEIRELDEVLLRYVLLDVVHPG